MFYDVLEDFLNNPSSDSNSIWQKTSFFGAFHITTTTGLQKGQSQGAHFEIFETNDMG
jgi:hypothetical protein